MDIDQTRAILVTRAKLLSDLKPFVSLSFYYQLSEKLKTEEKRYKALFERAARERKTLKQYSFVLNPVYFEQKLWKA